MDAHELMCWAYLLNEAAKPPPAPEPEKPLELSVEDEIAAWR